MRNVKIVETAEFVKIIVVVQGYINHIKLSLARWSTKTRIN